MKTCTKCKIPKEINEFGKHKNCKDGYENVCKECSKQRSKNWYNNNQDKVKTHREKIKEKQHKLSLDWYNKNKEKARFQNQQWMLNNKEKYNEHHKKRYKEDIIYKLKKNIRSSLRAHLKSNKQYIKHCSSIKLLGCVLEEYKQHLESQFKPEMNWSNHGEIWEIDHIKPCDSFDLTQLEEQQKCFHYTNLQPLFKTTEIAKSFGYEKEIGNRNKSSN